MSIVYLFTLIFTLFTSVPEASIINSYIRTASPHLTERYNNNIMFFVDLTKPSSDYRFFVIDLKSRKIIGKGLCCNGKTTVNGKVIYSNTPNSNCSSKGAYRIGGSYYGRFGLAYKMHGLETTNSNAYQRYIVLHSWSGVPRTPINYSLVESEGCPTVNPEYLKELSNYIESSSKPILLYIQ